MFPDLFPSKTDQTGVERRGKEFEDSGGVGLDGSVVLFSRLCLVFKR